MRHSQLALGYMTGGLLRGWAAALLVALLAAPFTSGLADPLIALTALFLTGLVFAVLGVITGMWAESFDQHSFVANLVITPLALVGGVFYCASTIGESPRTPTRRRFERGWAHRRFPHDWRIYWRARRSETMFCLQIAFWHASS